MYAKREKWYYTSVDLNGIHTCVIILTYQLAVFSRAVNAVKHSRFFRCSVFRKFLRSSFCESKWSFILKRRQVLLDSSRNCPHHLGNIYQDSKRNFVSPRGHVISSMYSLSLKLILDNELACIFIYLQLCVPMQNGSIFFLNILDTKDHQQDISLIVFFTLAACLFLFKRTL